MNRLGEILNVIGGAEMAISFTVLGIFTLALAKHGSHPYRRKLVNLFGFFILTSGISRGIGIFIDYPDPHVINGAIKVISGTAGMIGMFLIPKVMKEIARVQTIERTHREMDETKQAIDSLKDISDKLNIRNPR